MRTTIILAALLAALPAFAQAAPSSDVAPARVTALLTAYAKKDVPAVMAMLDPQAAMYGTVESEFFTTPEGIAKLLHADYQQWSVASFGAPRNVTVEGDDNLQSVFFDAPFSATLADGKQIAVTVRFATVWRKHGDRWLLLQSMNADVAR